MTVGGDCLTVLDLPPEIRQPNKHDGYLQHTATLKPQEETERNQILKTLQEVKGSRTEAAKKLGMSRVTLWKKIRRYGLVQQSGAAH